MALYDYVCLNCNNKKELFYHSNEETKDEITCKCGSIMKKQFPSPSFLTETSEMNDRIHKAEKYMGTGNLEPGQMPKHNGPKMWRGPGGGRTVGRSL